MVSNDERLHKSCWVDLVGTEIVKLETVGVVHVAFPRCELSNEHVVLPSCGLIRIGFSNNNVKLAFGCDVHHYTGHWCS